MRPAVFRGVLCGLGLLRLRSWCCVMFTLYCRKHSNVRHTVESKPRSLSPGSTFWPVGERGKLSVEAKARGGGGG